MSSEEDAQLWETLLKKSSKSQPVQGDGTVLVVGDDKSGKRTLVESLHVVSSSGVREGQEDVRIPEYLSYSYINSLGEDGSKVNMWIMGYETFDHSYDVVLHSDDDKVDQNIVIVVTIDLTKSDCATTLYKWLILVNSKINNFVEDSQKDSSTETQVTGLEETKESKVRRNKSTRPPVLVVGCKADTLEATGVESMAESKAKQGALRAVCLHGGASGLFFTTANAAQSPNSNCLALLEHLSLLLAMQTKSNTSDDSKSKSLISDGIIQDGTTDVIVPDTRADSVELIHSATDVDADLVIKDIQKNFSESANREKDKVETKSTSLKSVLLDDESQWLRQFLSAEKEVVTSEPSTSETGNAATGTTRRKSTLTTNPLAAIGTSTTASGLSSLLEQSTVSKEGTAKTKKKKSGEKKEKKDNPRGFFEDLLTK